MFKYYHMKWHTINELLVHTIGKRCEASSGTAVAKIYYAYFSEYWFLREMQASSLSAPRLPPPPPPPITKFRTLAYLNQ